MGKSHRTKVTERTNRNIPKKKPKSRKKTRKTRINSMNECNLRDESRGYSGESIMPMRTQDEVIELPQSGIWFYLRSDLGRALLLLVATIALSILTQRVQRQMEAEGI